MNTVILTFKQDGRAHSAVYSMSLGHVIPTGSLNRKLGAPNIKDSNAFNTLYQHIYISGMNTKGKGEKPCSTKNAGSKNEKPAACLAKLSSSSGFGLCSNVQADHYYNTNL